MSSARREGSEYHFESLWYDSAGTLTHDLPGVRQTPYHWAITPILHCRQSFSFPKMSLPGEYEDLFLSSVAPYFVYQIEYEIALLDIQALHYEEPYRRSLRFVYESVPL